MAESNYSGKSPHALSQDAQVRGEHLFSTQNILASMPCQAVVINETGHIVQANQSYCEDKGLLVDTVAGTDIRTVPGSDDLLQALQYPHKTELILQEDQDLVILSNIFVQGKSVGAMKLRFYHYGSSHPLDTEDNYSHLGEDIHKLFETNWDVIYASDENGITLKVSSASQAIWGMEPESLVGKSVYELEKKRIFYPSVTRMVLESKRRVQAIQTTATGKRLLVMGTPIKDESGNVIRVINTSRMILNENELSKELEDTKQLMDGYRRELERSRIQEAQRTPFIAHSTQMQNVAELAIKVSGTDIAVLLTGESGVGKEVMANYIASKSLRTGQPYIKINCGAIPPTLLESELFGYERGAFTGAERSGKPGIFELANKGTLFLDEISEIPITMQAKFLRVLQENELMRVGGTKAIPVDVRIIAATNKDLLKEIQNGTFRKDLYYRLNVVQIRIPPLRERTDDILPLSLFFLDKYNKKYRVERSFSPEVIDAFLGYCWDGNARELQNTVERMVVLSPQDVIGVDSLPEAIFTRRKQEPIHVDEIIPLRQAQQLVEDKLIELARKKYRTTTQIAQALGVDQSTISRKLRKGEP